MRKVWLLSLALVLALAAAGVAAAAWTESITIAGSVRTGDINPDFTAASTNDPGGTADPGMGKDVGSTAVIYTTDDLTVTVTNAYPGYNSTVTFTITNRGTVPIKIAGVVANNDPNQVVLSGPNIVGQVIDGGGSLEASFTQTVPETAAENATYTYTITITAKQWNLAGQ